MIKPLTFATSIIIAAVPSHAGDFAVGSVDVVRECISASQVFERLSELPASVESGIGINQVWTDAINGIEHVDVLTIVSGPNTKAVLEAKGGMLENLLFFALPCYAEKKCDGEWRQIAKQTARALKAACALDYRGIN